MALQRAITPHAEFMRVWEEGYVGTRATFEAMHMQGVGIFSGGHLLRDDGTLDRDRIRRWVADAVRGVPYARLRLLRSPGGLTPPAWVPDEHFDIDRHVRFTDHLQTLSPAGIPSLVGWDEGPLDLKHPLWRLQFTVLEDGRIALGVLMHHSGGDALRTLTFLATLTTNDPDAKPRVRDDPFVGSRAPRSGAELPLLSLRQWSADRRLTDLWREYWSRPVTRRARRVAGRLLRPWRDRRDHPHPSARSTGFRTVDRDAVQSAAAAAGGTINDIVVAAAIRTASADGAPVRIRVPVLRKRTEESRNRVTDVSISGSSAQPIAELVAAVRSQLETPDSPGVSPGARDVGYATLVPWLSRSRYLCGARLEDMIVLPAGLPTDELSTFALLYDGRLSIVATAGDGIEIEATMDRLQAELSGIHA